jgi:hypothetical protein
MIHEGQGRQALVGVVCDALEQGVEVVEQARHGGVLEDVGAVLDAAQQPFVDLLHLDGQVEFRGTAVDVELLQGEAGELEGLLGSVLEYEHHLEYRRVAQAPRDVELPNDLLERDGFMLVRLERHGSHSRQQLAERRITGQVGPQDQGIYEEADQRLELDSLASCRR